MKTITSPTVKIIGRQFGGFCEARDWLEANGVQAKPTYGQSDESYGEYLTEFAGRVCYMSFDKPRPGGTSAYIQHIKEVGHGSVLEHCVYTLAISGVSRSLTHELVRHRAGWAYSQLSQRYVDESVAEYVCPDIIANDPELYAIWHEAVDHAHQAYVSLAEKLNAKLEPEWARRYRMNPDLNHDDTDRRDSDLGLIASDRTTRRKAARQAARSVLPNATETKIVVTVNARALRHFFEQRGSRHAEPEIRKLANVILDLVAEDSEYLFGDYERTPLPDGTHEITTPYPKV